MDKKEIIRRLRNINLPSAQQWIPFKTRPLTAKEKEEHPEWDCVLECKLPDDGSYLDSEYEIGSEATAWMPLPEPYEETAIPEDDK